MAAQYLAAVALVIAKDESDRDVYIYEGGIVPENVTDASIKRLAAEGFITKIESTDDGGAAEEVTIPEGEPTSEWTVKQLKAYAGTLSIDLGKATNKDDILAVIVAASK